MELRMDNSPIIQQVFGNHNAVRNYLEFLKAQQNGQDVNPPFVPVLHREIACDFHDYETMLINEKSRHTAINKKVKNQLIQQFEIYSQMHP